MRLSSFFSCFFPPTFVQKEQRVDDQKRTSVQNKVGELLTEYEQVLKEIENEEETKLKREHEIERYRQDIVKLERMIEGLPDPNKSAPELKAAEQELNKAIASQKKVQDTRKALESERRDKEHTHRVRQVPKQTPHRGITLSWRGGAFAGKLRAR
jgi:hypothetical protein